MNIALFRIGASLCFLAVALGAFGAHALKGRLELNATAEIWKTAVLYHFVHALAIFILGLHGGTSRAPTWFFSSGILLFSGSLYLMALTNLRWLGAITPIGGLCFLAGWAWLVVKPLQ
ncbi:MAG: DUF423 domain-containing protein [Chthoniobacterales bacterium]|jgi:uncharacterized membrane protein YgdD (TMEM256/DUF423 family)